MRNAFVSGVAVLVLAGGGAAPSVAAPSSAVDASARQVAHERVSSAAAGKTWWDRFGHRFGRHATHRHWRWVRHHTTTRSVFRDVKRFRKQEGPYTGTDCWNTTVKSGMCEYPDNYTGIDFRRRPGGRIVVFNVWVD